MINILARMETLGIAFNPGSLFAHQERALERLRTIGALATALNDGQEFNLSSAAQLAKVLYENLGLPAPGSMGEA